MGSNVRSMGHSPKDLPRSRRLSARKAARQSVLVVDDDPFALRALRRQLSRDFVVETASCAEEAATKLQAHSFFCIITDYDMPVYNGIWLLSQVAANYPGTRRVLITGTDPGLFVPHVRTGLINRFVPKPATDETLFRSLEI